MTDPSTQGPAAEVTAVVVLAAGEGTRMRSRTPKMLHRVGGRSLLGHVLRRGRPLDPGEVVVVVGHGRDRGAAARRRVPAPGPHRGAGASSWAPGTPPRSGLAAGAARARATVLVVMGDTPLLTGDTLRRLAAAHVAAGDAVTVLTFEVDDPTGTAGWCGTTTGSPRAIVEQKDADRRAARRLNEVNSGMYAFDVA